jgi:hypothetical protein
MFNPSKFLLWMVNLPGYTPQIETLDITVCSSSPTGWGLLGGLEPFLVASHETLKEVTIGVEYQDDDLPRDLDHQSSLSPPCCGQL